MDALNRKVNPLQKLNMEVIGFEKLKEDYETCLDFGEVYASMLSDQPSRYNDFVSPAPRYMIS